MKIQAMRRKGNTVEGIVVPFARSEDDAFRTYWDANTDFALQMYAPQVILALHGVKGDLRQHGQLVELRTTAGGLFASIELNEDSEYLQVADEGELAASTMAAPHLIKQDKRSGYISRWPVIEISLGRREEVAAKRDLTKLDYQRSGLEIFEDCEFMRSSTAIIEEEWNEMPPEKEAKKEEESGTSELVDVVRGLSTAVTTLNERLSNPPEPPTRTLPPKEKSPLDLDDEEDKYPVIPMRSKWDGVSALGLLLWDEANAAMNRYDRQYGYDRSDEFLRALAVAVEKEWKKDQEIEDRYIQIPGLDEVYVPMRAIDEKAYRAWTKYFPYMRSAEAMSSTGANIGDELVPTLLHSMVYHYYRKESNVLGLFESFQMPSNPFDYPKITGGPTYRYTLESVDQADYTLAAHPTPTSKIDTDKVTFNARKLGALTLIPRELLEDIGVGAADAFMAEYVRQGAAQIDRTIISGDETATTANSGHVGEDPTGTAYDWVLALNGLRELALTASDAADVTTLADADYITVAQLMGTAGKFGADTPNLAVICDLGTYFDLLALTTFQKLNEVGNVATLVNRNFGFWAGVPVIVPDPDVYELTNATGLIEDSHDTTLSSFLIAHRPTIKVGWRRGIEHNMAKPPGIDGYFLESSFRMDMQPMETGAIGYGYNVGGS